jgi:hypothetical protein
MTAAERFIDGPAGVRHPSAGGHQPRGLWETKLWFNDRFAMLADRLVIRKGVDVVFTGGPGDRGPSSMKSFP